MKPLSIQASFASRYIDTERIQHILSEVERNEGKRRRHAWAAIFGYREGTSAAPGTGSAIVAVPRFLESQLDGPRADKHYADRLYGYVNHAARAALNARVQGPDHSVSCGYTFHFSDERNSILRSAVRNEQS